MKDEQRFLCDDCFGSGKDEHGMCLQCEGTGEIFEEDKWSGYDEAIRGAKE